MYLLGASWYSFVTAQGLYGTFFKAVLPFLPGDGAKLILAASLAAGYNHLRSERKK
jgi:biotin transporter BioY